MTYRLLIFTIVLFSLGELLRFDVGNGVVVHGTDILICLISIGFLLQKGSIAYIRQHVLLRPILFFTAAAAFSLLINSFSFGLNELLVASLYLFRWVVYALVIFVVSRFSDEQKRGVFKAFIYSGVLFIIFGFLQYAFYPNLRNLYYLQWDDHLYRLFSTFFDPNFAAVAICLFLFGTTGLILQKKTFRETWIWVILGMMGFIALLLTYSRSGYLMFIVGMVTLLWLAGRKRLIWGLVAILVMGIFIIPKDLRSEGVELWRTASIFARTESAGQAVKIVVHNPVFGVGFNTYRYAQYDYGFATMDNWEVSHSGGGTDNSWLFVLATTGLVGFAAWLYMWWKIIGGSYLTWKKSKTQTIQNLGALVLLASLAALVVNAFFINSLFYPYVMLWMWSMIGLTYVKIKNL